MASDSYYQELDAQLQENLLQRRMLISSRHMLRLQFFIFLGSAIVASLAIAGYVFWQVRFGDSFFSHLDILGGSLGILAAFVAIEMFIGAFTALQASWRATILLHAQDHAISLAEECLQENE